MSLNPIGPQHNRIVAVLRHWRAIEASIPHKATDSKPADPRAPVYRIDLASPQSGKASPESGSKPSATGYDLPWQDASHLEKFLSKDKQWSYRLECGLYKTSALDSLLEERIGKHPEVFADQSKQERSRLFDLAFDSQGIPVAETFVLSLACWSAGQILSYENGIEVVETGGRLNVEKLPGYDADIRSPMSGYAAFDELCCRVMQWIRDESAKMKQNDRVADSKWLLGVIRAVAGRCLLPDDLVEPNCIAKCYQVKNRPTANSDQEQPQESSIQDMLNSFFIGDLNLLSNRWGKRDVGAGFHRFMTAVAAEPAARVDLRDNAANGFRLAAMSPAQFPIGRWPSDYPLVFSQQLAVNEISKRLSDPDASGLFSVNGPPGTGKTTLLRDVVASVVTERAIALADSNNSLFGKKKSVTLGERSVSYHELSDAVRGTAIVVASANNGAVENISLELPGAGAVPKRVNGRGDYFSMLAERLLATRVRGKLVFDKPAWGLLAARLGNKSNRGEFLSRFWFGKPSADHQPESATTPGDEDMGEDEGLHYHLTEIAKGNRNPTANLAEAKLRFQRARANEDAIRQTLIEVSTIPEHLQALRTQEQAATIDREKVDAQIITLQQTIETLDAELSQSLSEHQDLEVHYQDCASERDRALANRPGLLLWIASLGKSHRDWAEHQKALEADHYQARKDLANAKQTLKRDQRALQDGQESLATEKAESLRYQRQIQQLRQAVAALEERKAREIAFLQSHWPDLNQDADSVEASSPWSTREWRDAREEVFLAALELHRAFIESHPRQVSANLRLATDWLNGKTMPEALAQLAMDSLCLVVPVISTAFPSVPTMFKPMGREAIGWLLIDEAGQALPEQAAGAIWRARRTIVVGDPKQLEPVSTVPASVEGAFAAYYDDIPTHWWPSKTSVQCMADQSMDIGTWLPDVDEESLWLACPLRVHRRCDAPMFEISNRIAYDGMMVQGKAATQSLLPVSQWFDVQSETSNGHWVPDEEGPLRQLIKNLTGEHGVDHGDIFLISPFRDVASALNDKARSLGLDRRKVGTVHTAQGKEARVVIIVLGGNPGKAGAKGWAAAKPNLLNVAVSRAKERLYVIGNRQAWAQHQYFNELARHIQQREQQVEPAAAGAAENGAVSEQTA